MRFIDYVLGERRVLASDLSPDEVADRLNAEIDPLWMPFATGVVGWVAFGRFVLRYRRYALLRRDWLPVLVGRIGAQGSGSSITLHYRAPRLLAAFIFLFVLLFLGIARQVFAAFGTRMLETLLPFGAILILIVVLGIWSVRSEADDDLAEMLAVVETAAGLGG